MQDKKGKVLTNDAGIPVSSDEFSLTVGMMVQFSYMIIISWSKWPILTGK